MWVDERPNQWERQEKHLLTSFFSMMTHFTKEGGEFFSSYARTAKEITWSLIISQSGEKFRRGCEKRIQT